MVFTMNSVKKSTRNQFALLDYHMKKTMSFNRKFLLINILFRSGYCFIFDSSRGSMSTHTHSGSRTQYSRFFGESPIKFWPTILHTVTRRRSCCIILTQASFPVAKVPYNIENRTSLAALMAKTYLSR